MRLQRIVSAAVLCLAAQLVKADDQKPITLAPDNPHYFLFRGKPAILVGSTEHYGAVLNGRFDQTKYLDTVKSDGLNLTRTFSGTYREVPGSFRIAGNTLAPEVDSYVAPWPRSHVPGALDGRNKFDLSRWNDAYFARLKSFVAEAGRRGIVVEYVLFCPFYEQAMWDVSPMNAKNNVNGAGDLARDAAYTLHNGKLLEFQDSFIRKAVSELRNFDNVYFEICNEPYFGGVTLDWQQHIAATIADAEKDFPARHLIAQNIANGSKKIQRPDPLVSIFNFHYANPPSAVSENSHLDKVISYDETGFKKTHDDVYRQHGWEFLMAGGAVYDNLDYSFTVGHEDGTATVKDPTPGGGGRALRSQLGAMKRFIETCDFVHMRPGNELVKAVSPPGTQARVLAEPGRHYAIYLRRKNMGRAQVTFLLDLPAGRYQLDWVNPVTGRTLASAILPSETNGTRVTSPAIEGDIAVRVAAGVER